MRTRNDGQEELWPNFEAILETIKYFLVEGLIMVAFVALIYGAIREYLPH